MGNGKGVGELDMVEVKPGGANCLVLGDSIVRIVGAANADMKVKCFPGIRADQLRRIMDAPIGDK
jgi:hypothetical protein